MKVIAEDKYGWPSEGVEPVAPKMESFPKLDKMTTGYLEAALWASSDNSDEQGGLPLDTNYDFSDIAQSSLDKAVKDCGDFYKENSADLDGVSKPLEQIGHDFFLTRERHGAGFWDGDYEHDVGERLTASAHEFGELNIYVGDDGKVYIE